MPYSNPHLRTWSLDEFSNSKEDWTSLLARSKADPLFMSWDWMFFWYQTWGAEAVEKLFIVAAYDDNQLVGLAPLYISKPRENFGKIKTLFGIRNLEIMGSRHRVSNFIRAEYQQFIADESRESSVVEDMFEFILKSKEWDELILPDVVTGSETHKFCQRLGNQRSYYLRVDKSEETYVVDCSGTFEEYLGQLGKNTRLKLFNRRKLLESQGKVEHEYADINDLSNLLDDLNGFHKKRWGKDCFDPMRSQFISSLISSLEKDEGGVVCSTLQVDGQTLSCIVNVSVGDCIYNIQLGFDEEYHKKIALGTLHIGYVLEDAFSDQRIKRLDFLAGTGKNSNYKSRISRPSIILDSVQIIRHPITRYLYVLKDWLSNVRSH